MLASVYKALDIERGEGKMVALLIIQSFFIGVFNINLVVAAETMFLQTFDEDMIGLAYLFSGVAGIIMAAIYSRLQSAMRFSLLAFFNFLTIAAITTGIWYGLTISDNKWLIFGLF
ncbi:MAG: hypothetical protein JKY42_08590, partial [Flavobacteriales bacterium]|nr:hypothetical protein [Flavobacteriales bacterium]